MLSQSSFRSHPELAAVPQIHRREAIVSRDDREGAQTLQQWPAVAGYPGGVIGLNRLEGEDPRRYEHRFYVCRFRASIIAAARVSWDHVDQRARILDLKTAYEGLQEVLVPALVAELIKAAGNDPLSVVVDVRADAIKLQNTLGQLQFHPSVYYPAFVGDADDRHDVVQFVRLHQHSSVDSLRGLECLSTWNNDWPLARRLALIVIEGIATLRVVPVRE
jgi:hypothetical protein